MSGHAGRERECHIRVAHEPRPRDDIESLDYDIDGSTIFEQVTQQQRAFLARPTGRRTSARMTGSPRTS